MSIENLSRQYQNIVRAIALLNAILIIDERMLADTLDKIQIDIYLDNGLPQIDISVANGATEIFNGSDFSTFQETLIKMAENIKGDYDG